MKSAYDTETDKVRQGETKRMTPILVTSTVIAAALLAILAIAAPL